MSEILVDVQNVTRVFDPPRRMFQRRVGSSSLALDAVSIQAAAGDCLALIGPNGAGKSTLLRILATLILPTSGFARVCGFDVVRSPAAVRARMGYAGAADRSFFWPLSGMENLEFFGKLGGLDAAVSRRRALRWLERVGLTDARENRVAGYSAGMRQRLGLARALLHDPAVILLDEPTANLDAEYRDVTIDVIAELVAGGRAILVATHDPGLVASSATRIVRLQGGRVVEAAQTRRPAEYRLRLAADPGDPSSEGELVIIEDLGDGHALAAELSRLIAAGRDVAAVERSGSRTKSQ